jgi:hypothetical protein
MRSSASKMVTDAEQPALPEGTFDRAMHAHLEVIEERVRRLYVRPRALFAEAIVAALVDGTLVEFPAAAWDVEMPLPRRRRPVRIQVKCSGERAPQSPDKLRPPDWGRLTPPKSAKDSEFRVLAAGFNCDVFVFARHEGIDIGRGWHFHVLPQRTVKRAVAVSPAFDLRRLEQLHAVRCEPSELRRRITEAVSGG